MICIIIPMYGFNQVTKKCIDKCLENAGVEDFHILVVDDCSPEPFVDERVSVLRLEKNSGWTEATNRGILWCKDHYEYIFLLNNDTEPEEDFLKILLEEIVKDEWIGLVSSVRINHDKAGTAMHIENFGVDLIRGHLACTQTDLEDHPIIVPWLPTCACLIPYKVIQAVGLFDKRMRTFCSDNDYCIRLHQMGYKVILVPKSRVKHYHQMTISHTKEKPDNDQNMLLQKHSCAVNRQLFEQFPIDMETQTWGKLDFKVYKKDDKLNQPATA